MIEKMKKVVIVAPQERKASMLSALRDFGAVHVSETAAPNSSLSDKLSQLNRIRAILTDQAKKNQAPVIEGESFEALHGKLVHALEEKKVLEDEIIRLGAVRESVAKWGDFIPQEVLELKDTGLEFNFYLLGKKEFEALPENVSYIRLQDIDKQNAIAVLGSALPDGFSGNRFVLPEKGLGQIERETAEKKKRLAEIASVVSDSAAYISSYDKAIALTTDEIVFNRVGDGAASEDCFTLIQGFIPVSDVDAFKKASSENCWAYAMDDPSDEDFTPTKVRYNRVTKMMRPLFDMLGTVPGYREYDISMWFLLFFALFFAMIIGDAAYGLILLAACAVLHVKSKKLSNVNLLLYVMSVATIFWGAITGTWFGAEEAMKIPFLKALVIPAIANYPEYFGVDSTAAQNAVMKFCFAVGTIQLSLACVMNIIRKWKEKSLAFLADAGWLVMILSIYNLVLMLVIGEKVNVGTIFTLIIVGFFTVVIFGGQEHGKSFFAGLKTGLGGAFITFLNSISAFGNVMSYIRLFAVGMASLAIAQSFNGMASSMLKGLAFPAGVLVLLLGHGLNIVMGALSVIVHGVRLNLLEFSGQLGMEWTGIPYEPFRKKT